MIRVYEDVYLGIYFGILGLFFGILGLFWGFSKDFFSDFLVFSVSDFWAFLGLWDLIGDLLFLSLVR